MALMVPAPTVAAVLALLRGRGGVWAEELAPGRALRVALNHTVANGDAPLRNGDEMALLPPVTGG
jgi:molybdopterin synthase sulfur carrier subunit